MRIYNNDRDKYSGRRSGGRSSEGSRYGGRSQGQVTMHPAVCDDCGRECEVPFRPSSDKPIYCSRCFENQDGGSRDRDRGRDRDRRPSRDSGRGNDMFSAVCDDCGKECQVPFKPSGDKPIYCSRCFENRGNTHEGQPRKQSAPQSNLQLDSINEKLDRLIALLEPKEEKKVVKKKVTKTKVEDTKEEPKEKAKKVAKSKAKKEKAE